MKISVITINYNTNATTISALKNLKIQEPSLDMELILIDNNSNEKFLPDNLNGLNINFIQNKHNVGFARAVNQGLKIARGKYILMLNSDLFIQKKVISKLLNYLEQNENVGIIGPKMIYPSGRIQVSCGRKPSTTRELMRIFKLSKIFAGGTLIENNLFNRRYFKKVSDVDWVSGGCLLIKKEVIKKIGLLDEQYFFGIEDIDYGYRVRQAGWQVIFYPLAKVIHYHGNSVGGKRSVARLKNELQGIIYFLEKFKLSSLFGRRIVSLSYSFKIKVLQMLSIK